MGLGLHGGGLASARFFAERGAEVTVTDLRDEKELRPSIEKLSNLTVRYVLGKHETEDFSGADLVIKNPAVTLDSPYLQAAKHIETDISIFLQLYTGRIVGVTGTKGKSTAAAAIQYLLKTEFPGARLGGNITISPLTFLGDTDGKSQEPSPPVILELSSWQLADLRGKGVLNPDVALITNILRDHQNRYASMDDYVSDKMVLFEGQTSKQTAIVNYDDPVLLPLSDALHAKVMYFSKTRLPSDLHGVFLDGLEGICRNSRGETRIIPEELEIRGSHNRLNLLAAALAARSLGLDPVKIRRAAARFKGIEHRLEFVKKARGISFYNDSAATIPDAVIAAVQSFSKPVILIAGGTDKELDFALFKTLREYVKAIHLLDGTATAKIVEVLQNSGTAFKGPFASLEKLFESIMQQAGSGDTVVFSPGCASFGMFKNEFDRGNKFKMMVQELE
jgi:UDP-N-acetylmuramoylalanine--D-glutamate ligase